MQIADTTRREESEAKASRSRTGGRGRGGASSGGTTDTTTRETNVELSDDSTWVVCLDSTARLAQWKYTRRDSRQVEFFPDRTYPLFAKPTQTQLRHEVIPDSTLSSFRFRQKLGDADVKIPLELSLKHYVAARQKYELRKLFADEARKPKALQVKRDIGDVFSSFTKIQIPVPANPIFSIFGKPEINLQISGGVDIRAGFRNTTSDRQTANPLDQTRNEPDFNQEVQVAVNGTIGDKLNILADWNTQRTFEYENQLKIKYTGYEDEIVQSVEAGNVSLQTPSQFIGSSAALFGIKAKFQAGPLTLTTLASQKKGQIKEVEAKGGSQDIPFEIQPWNFSTNHFWVDTLYRRYYEPYYQNDPPTVTPEMQQSQIVEIEVWAQYFGSDRYQTRNGIANIDLGVRGSGYDSSARNQQEASGRVESALFKLLEKDKDYELVGDGYLGVVSLSGINDNQTVAVAYRTNDGRQVGEFFRDIPSDTTTRIVLRMLRPRSLISNGPSFRTAWDRMLKNIYSIGARNVKQEGFSLEVVRKVTGQEDQKDLKGKPLLRVLGLDRFNTTGNLEPDNVFDFRSGRTINQARAEIIFPSLRPFDTQIVRYFQSINEPLTFPADSAFLYREIYDTTRTEAQRVNNDKNYVIKGSAKGEASSKYNLGFNVVEGSVKVLLNGAQLTPNVDYTVDYIVGEVIIRNQAALVPGANLQIKYEQNDLFQLASKTLLGARGDLFVSQNTSFGFTLMNLNQQSLSDKVRLGEEPNKNTIMGIDGQTSFKLPFLTNAIDALPLLQTREGSELRLTGEWAYVIPDPNTRKSTIASDGGESIAFIDDFEGARRTIPLGTTFSQWFSASPPAAPSDSSLFARGTPDSVKMNSKAKTIWYNVFNVPINQIYPDKRAGNAANSNTTVMDVLYTPRQRGTYNYTGNTDTLAQKNWGGIMKPISIAGTNLITENISFIELWMEVINPGGSMPGKIFVDIGSISEDAVPYATRSSVSPGLNTEDLVPPSTTINNSLQPYEDVGLDMLSNAEEVARYGAVPGIDPADPSGDDYVQVSGQNVPVSAYNKYNGTENNRQAANGIYPDTEDLNANGIVDRSNSYFRYELSLDTVRSRNPRVVGGGIKGSTYYQFRIPIRDTLLKVGSPTFENVEHVRLAFQNAQDSIWLRIAEFSLVGNQWQEVKRDDSTLAVAVIGIEENSNSYASPPGVIRERDKTRPDEDVVANEQALALILRGLNDGDSRQAVKFLTYRPLDVFNYKKMKMFVHGDEAFRFVDTSDYDAEFFFRFGADSLHFYEYRAPIHPSQPTFEGDPNRAEKLWNPLNNVEITFSDLTAIKEGRDSTTVLSRPIPVPGGPPGATYRVLGNPSLTQIRYMAYGVTNPRGKGTQNPLRGQVWVNELRVISVDDEPGSAYRFDVALKLADVANVQFNYSKVDPNFHGLEQRFGSRQTGINWGLSANMELGKFFPAEWSGTSIPISYSHSENLTRPKYLPNSDVAVDAAAVRAGAAGAQVRFDSESFRVSDTWAAPTFRIGLPSDEWWIRDTWNKLTFGFNYTKSRERNPSTVRRLSWQWSARIAYALTFNPEYFFQPFKNLFDGLWFLDEYKDLKIYYSPQSFNWAFQANRSRDVSLNRSLPGQPPAQEQISRNFNASRSFGLSWKLTENGILNPSGDYALSIESSWLDLETDPRTKAQRRFSSILDDIFFNNALINFGQDRTYLQRNNFNTRPNIPNIFNIKKYMDLTFSYGVDYNWQNAPERGDLAKSAGWSNNINASMNFKLKSLFDPLFEESPSEGGGFQQNVGGRRREEEEQRAGQDSTAAADSTAPTGKRGMEKTLAQLKTLVKVFIKVPFLDYDNINITFTQSNRNENSGVVGRPGFVNFWGRVPFIQDADPKYGPSRLYQLGLISDPHGRLTNFGARSKFPWFGWDVEEGIRAPNGVLSNRFSQQNRLTFKTNRALWEGARLDLTWNVGWSNSRNEQFNSDSLGRRDARVNPVITSSGSIERSFLTFPNVLFLGLFKTDIKKVAEKYQQLRQSRGDTVKAPDEEKIATAFEEGFEALPFFTKLFGKYTPRVNWSLRWDGLERVPLFSGIATRVSLDHSYTSSFTRGFENKPGVGERTNAERVAYGFAPLVGLNISFKEFLKGQMGATLRYNTNTTYDLSLSARNIVETLTQEISVSANYSRRGFEIPFFGLSLNNDLEFNASYSRSKNSKVNYELLKLAAGNVGGDPLEGSTRTTFEPRIKYTLSQRVNASVYYRLTKITPDQEASTIPGSTTNEAGLDIHISIQ